jgi:hypothetical protein
LAAKSSAKEVTESIMAMKEEQKSLFGGAGLSVTESEKVNKDVTRLDWRLASRPLLQNGADTSVCQPR